MSEAAETENPARYALFKALFLPSEGMSRASADGLINAFAHELAEQIRADIIPELDEYGTREQQAEIDGRRGAADLIDPSERPVSIVEKAI
ncbi:hypothetical protein [Streptomyces ipomoeae]|uniref:hypothetical protein n=1 Tax=Streptomyces ipomoeae TaxID=103232 RepID=UPI0029B8D28A|nr:hypothetical protein [Streptomyces ipomoeae]MDX2697598.1 hypothetical protein [Streptomyces ipomoeae]MDX2838033.1 hypothetical protein [Streptomyces ipomoeae]